MADLNLNINGRNNASGPLNDAAGGVKNLSGEIAKGITIQEAWNKALSVGIGFAKDSFKAYEEQAKADRQLARVAGESTEAFKAQATALQEQLGVSDDAVQQMQKMLLTYGEAPAEIDKTIRAILDMSAATGQDAVGAISTLTSSVTTGKGAFKDLGLEYDKTGSRGDVLGAATAALAKKFAGSSEAEADSLAGAINKSMQQFGELKETFGGFIGLVAQKTGIIESATWAFKQFNEAIGGGPDNTRMEAIEKLQHAQNLIQEYATIEKSGVELNQTSRDTLHEAKINYYEALKLVNEIDAKNKPLATKGKADDTAAGNGKAAAAEAKAAAKAAQKEHINDFKDSKREEFDAMLRSIKEQDDAEKDAEKKRIADFAESKREQLDEMLRGLKAEEDAHEKSLKKDAEITKKAADEQKKQEATWAQAGASIGNAFAGALSSAIEELASGGEMDAGETIGSILAAVLAVAGGVLGGALGGPAGAAIGGALGGLAGSAIKGATKRKKVRHSGGYAGEDAPERYHLGTWVGSDEEAAILQNGERVLSRSEVSGMGGKQGVENAVRGGGGMTVNVSTFSAGGFRELFEGDGGRGLLNAARTGRGAPAFLFGGGR